MTRFTSDALSAPHTQRELGQITDVVREVIDAPADPRAAVRREIAEVSEALAIIQRRRDSLTATAAAMGRHILDLRRSIGE